ncbi:MAG: SDR family NAD(P)-dependent oxidoreductase [Pseudomonadota bacterium]
MSQAGRIALVTGVGKETGLGFAVSQAMLDEGMTVYVTARTPAKADSVVEMLRVENGATAIPLGIDIADTNAINAAADVISKSHGRLDILVNNAAMMSPYGESAATADLAQARAVFDATVFGSWAVCSAMLPLLRTSDAGRIVNVSSGAGSHGDEVFGLTTGNQMGTSYAASKAALNALTVKLAYEEMNTPLKINAVCPGFTATFDGGEAMGARPPAESAKGILWAATLPDDGPTAGFFRDGEPLPW